ncbi:SusE domain-containing protein [Dysgonomonas reticulitermitis]
MKRFIFPIIFIASLLCFVSCGDDNSVSLNPDKYVSSSWTVSFDGAFILDKADAENMMDTLRWTPADFGYGAAISYEVQVAVKNEGDLTFVTLGTTNQTKYGVKIKDLNATLLAAGAVKRRPTDFVMRVNASISAAYSPLISNSVEFNATTFSTDPDLLYVVGDYNNFDMETAEVLYSPNWNGKYEGYVYLSKLDQGIKLIEEIAPEVQWGLPGGFTPATSVNIAAGGAAIAPGSFMPGANGEEIFDGPGFYRMIVDITETSKTFKLYKFYNDFFVAGQRNMNYTEWANSMSNQNPKAGTGALLTYNPEGKVWEAKKIYIPEYQTDANGVQLTGKFQFKLRANFIQGTWTNAANIGIKDSNSMKDNMQVGNITPGGGNINFIAPEGYYDIKVYMQCYPQRFELIPSTE